MTKSTRWRNKIAFAVKKKKEWESKFRCKELMEYYEGRQWVGAPSEYYPYVLNLIYTAIETKQAANLIKNPKFLVTAKPGFSNWNQELATRGAQLKEDALNTIIGNPKSEFLENIELSDKDYYFRFSVIEVQYEADWRNPAKKPVITEAHDDPDERIEDAKVIEDAAVPENERLYFKHIFADSFYVVPGKGLTLEKCSWCGYFEWIDNETLLNTKTFKLPETFEPQEARDDSELHTVWAEERTKIWKIWDNETSTFLVLIDGFEDEPILEEVFEHIPFRTRRGPHRPPNSKDPCWYPIPLVSQWMSQQDEANESREQARNIRRRATRKFQVDDGSVDEDNLDKFAANIDGTIITKRPGTPGIEPIQNAEIGSALNYELIASKDDFNHVAGVSEARQSDRTTATQAKINASREMIRESDEQNEFRTFVAGIGQLALLHMSERFSEGMWAQYSLDPESQEFGSEIEEMAPIFRWINSDEINDGYDFKVDVNVVNENPEVMQEEMSKFVGFLSLIAQFPAIAMDPVLIYEAAQKTGYRNMRVVRAMQRAAMINMLGMAAEQDALSGGAPGANNAKATVDNQAGNSIGEIQSQMQSQLA